MPNSRSSLFLTHIALLLVLVAADRVASALYQLTVYRAVQFDVGDERFGSRSSQFNLPGAVGESAPPHSVRVLRACHDSDQVVLDSKSSATLVLLPKDPSPSQLDCLKSMESTLLSREWTSPIYFAYEDSETEKIANSIATNPYDRYQFTVSTAEAEPISSPRFSNINGWLSDRSDSNRNTIAIVAGWDSFSAVPGVTSGSSSAVASILELMRIFRGIKDSEGLGKHSLLFVVTGASAFNGLGYKKFLTSVDARIIENVELVVCLDSLSSDHLYIHSTPESASSDTFAKFQKALSTSAKEAGMQIQTLSKETEDASDDQVQFPHHRFAREHVITCTISSLPSLPEHRFRVSSMFDAKESSVAVARSTNVIAEALARFMFNVKDAALGKGNLSVNADFITSWMNYFHSQPTLSPILPKEATIIEDLQQEFESFLDDVETKTFEFDDGSYRFFADAPKLLSIFQVKPFLFDLSLVGGVSAYLATVYFTCKFSIR